MDVCETGGTQDEDCVTISLNGGTPIEVCHFDARFSFPKRAMESDWEVTILEMPEGKDYSVSYEKFNDGRFEADV